MHRKAVEGHHEDEDVSTNNSHQALLECVCNIAGFCVQEAIGAGMGRVCLCCDGLLLMLS